MTELVFFSTNRVKLAHFKYLGRKLGLRVSGFREKSFYASYHEPKIDNRETLLRESYESALKQWSRTAAGKKDTGFFFFEDTSVRIDALSGNQETPGVNVKYWMKGMTFRKLDELLRQHGGDRTATVRSDIILHIPKRIREAKGLKENYVWVSGETKGKIAERQRKIDQNLVYPWLDNRTFNRWFVPDGFEKPISALEISQADIADFRRKAFEKIGGLLGQYGALPKPEIPEQSQLLLPSVSAFPSVLLICGGSCAGKTTLATWLRQNHRFMHLEASDFMYQAFWERHGVDSIVRIGDFAEAALKTEPSIVAEPVATLIHERQYPAVVVTGFRSPDEFMRLRNLLEPERLIDLVYLDASEAIRLERALRRARDNVSQEKFHKRNRQEIRMGLEKIRTLDACKIIPNERTLSSLYGRFSRRYKGILEIVGNTSRKPSSAGEGELETLILLTLLREHKAEKGFTTTQIAGLLNKHFGQQKSKNNVSRYFTQGYHPFYEVQVENRTALYRLSTTGVSEAYRLQNLGVDRTVRRQPPHKRVIGKSDLFE